MSTPNPIVQAALPSAIDIVQALRVFVTTVTTGDPATLPTRIDGALKIFLGTVELQFPVLATTELSAVGSDVNAKLASWITSLQALGASSAAPASTTGAAS